MRVTSPASASVDRGVDLKIDGVSVGKTPYRARLSVGPHTLEVPATIQTSGCMQQIVTATFDHWFGIAGDPITTMTGINVVATSPGDSILNSVSPLYAVPDCPPPPKTPFRITMQAVGPKSSGDIEFYAVKAHVIDKTCHGFCLFNVCGESCQCKYHIAPYTDITLGDFETSIIGDVTTYPSGNKYLRPSGQANSPISFQLQVLAVDGTPVPNTRVKIWWTNPTIFSQVFNGNMIQLLSTDLTDGEAGTDMNPIIRTSDGNGIVTVTFWPALFWSAYSAPAAGGTIEDYACHDQLAAPSAEQKCVDDLCILVFGSTANCGPSVGDRRSIGTSGSDWVCTNNGTAFTPSAPRSDFGRPTLNAACVDTPSAINGIVPYSIQMQIATKGP